MSSNKPVSFAHVEIERSVSSNITELSSTPDGAIEQGAYDDVLYPETTKCR